MCQPKFFQIEADQPPLRLPRPEELRKGSSFETGNSRSSSGCHGQSGRAGDTHVFQAGALMVLEKAVLAAEAAVAEAAVADDALRGLAALLVRAAQLAGRHAAAQRRDEVDCGLGLDAEGREGGGGGGVAGEVLAGVGEA